MSSSIEVKRRKEQKTIRLMIGIYCRKNAHLSRAESSDRQTLCPACQELWEYARARVAHCPRMAEKTFCSCCPVHCYRPDMQARIRSVMRFSGPRMLFVQPVSAMRHAVLTMRFRRTQKKQG